MSYLTLPRFGLGMDWETSGFSVPDYAAKHQGISFGAIIFDFKSLDPVEELYREVKFDATKYLWDAGAERVHGLSQAHLAQHGVTQEEAAVDLANLVIKYFSTEDIILLGHRVHFDRAFTQQLTESQGIFINYHPTTLDSASIGAVLMETSKSEEIFQTMGMPPRKAHNSLEDIKYTLESLKRMKEYFLAGVLGSLET